MKKHYVYTITYNGEVMYVGKTCNFKRRKEHHKYERGTSSSAIPVDADMSKVVFNVVAEFNNNEEALKYEDQLILQYDTIDNGWNRQRSGLIKSSDIKAYSRDYNRDYRAAHREDIAAYQRDYRAEHKEEKAAYNREYQAAHREDIAEYKRDYRATHKEDIAAYMRDYMRAYRAQQKALGNSEGLKLD